MGSTTIVMFPSNEQKLQLLGLKDDQGNPVNNAVVTATLRDAGGNVIAGVNGVGLTNINANGDYSFTITAASFAPAAQPATCTFVVTIGGIVKLTLAVAVSIVLRIN